MAEELLEKPTIQDRAYTVILRIIYANSDGAGQIVEAQWLNSQAQIETSHWTDLDKALDFIKTKFSK